MSESAVVNQRGEVNKTGRALTLFALLRPAFLSGASTITWTHFSAAPWWQLHLFCQLKKRRKQLDGKWKRKRRSSPSSPPLHSLRLSFFFFFFIFGLGSADWLHARACWVSLDMAANPGRTSAAQRCRGDPSTERQPCGGHRCHLWSGVSRERQEGEGVNAFRCG